jgi:hypothetical protein
MIQILHAFSFMNQAGKTFAAQGVEVEQDPPELLAT